MECPKCGYTIDENTLVCPNCKKVLKLICPQCKTLNKSNTCKKCGFVIVTKCHQCGKINKTANGFCSNCGFSTYVSAVLNDSNIEDFACITINFPNINEVKKSLKSNQLFEKFKNKLDKFIKDYFISLKLKPQIIDETYVIRFNKDFTFKRSAMNSVLSAIAVLNSLIKTNLKLTKLRNIHLNCNVAIFKRNVSATNDDYKSGVNIQLLYQNISEQKHLQGLQLIVDQNIYEAVRNKFDLSALGSTIVKNTSVMLFELDLAKYLEKPQDEPEEEVNEEEFEIPEFKNYNENEENNELYDMNDFSFEDGKCKFVKVSSKKIIPTVIDELLSENKTILSVKASRELRPSSKNLLEQIKAQNKYKKVYSVTCTDLTKNSPYGFFRELISIIYNYTLATTEFKTIRLLDELEYVKNLVTMTKLEKFNPEETRKHFSFVFKKLLMSLTQALIVVDDFNKIDDTSLDVLREVFDEYEKYPASFLLMSNKDFSLHKASRLLLQNPYYTEIAVKPSSFIEFYEPNKQLYKNLTKTFYFKKIAEHTQGSNLYFMLSTLYFVDTGVLKINKGAFEIVNDETVVLPVSLDELIQKRLILLSQDNKAYELLAKMLLLGPRIDSTTVNLLGLTKYPEELKKLEAMGYIYFEGYDLYIQNYNLYLDNILNLLTQEEKKKYATELLSTIFLSNQISPVKAHMYKLAGDSNSAFNKWLDVVKLNINLGDFYAFFNCGLFLMQTFNLSYDESENEFIEEWRKEFFDNIIKYLYNYNAKKSQNVVNAVLQYLELTTQNDKIITLCNKLLIASIDKGHYSEALIFAYKILSKTTSPITDVSSSRFSKEAYFISLLKVDILFNLGDLEKCFSLGLELFEQLKNTDISKIKSIEVDNEAFKYRLVNMVEFTILAGILLMKPYIEEFMAEANKFLGLSAKNFESFISLKKLICGENVSIQPLILEEDRFTGVISSLVNTLSLLDKDINNFVQEIYRVKLLAQKNKLHSFELFADIMIGLAYFKTGNIIKAGKIYKNILSEALDNGIKNIMYLCWYFIANLNSSENHLDVAEGLINNAIIQLEKDGNSSEYVLMNFKIALSGILKQKGEDKKSVFCYNQAKLIAQKYGINLK